MFQILFEKNYNTHKVAILCMNASCMQRNAAVNYDWLRVCVKNTLPR